MIDWFLELLESVGDWARSILHQRKDARRNKEMLRCLPINSLVRMVAYDGGSPKKLDTRDGEGIWVVVAFDVISDQFRLVRPDGSSRQAYASLEYLVKEAHLNDWQKGSS